MNLLFIDTETTGRDETARLVQLAYKTSGAKKCEVFYFKPPIPISIEAMSVHHITNEMVANKPEFVCTEEYKKLFEDHIVVAHNAPFDIEILKREGLEPKQYICTLKVVQNLFDLSQYKLQFLRYNFGLEITQVRAHDAEGDVEVLEALFNYLFHTMARQNPEWGETEIINQMLRWSSEPLPAKLLEICDFGTHRDKHFSEVPKSYLIWLKNEREKKPNPNESERRKTDLNFTINYYLNK